jgi:23S rRNA (adenine2503-C2)-methyltransferase
MDEPPKRPALQSLCPQEVVALAPDVELGEARKLISQVHRLGGLPTRSPSEVRRRSLDQVRGVTSIPTLRLLGRATSAIDGFIKYTMATASGGVVEAVKIPLEHPGRVAVCVSSQVGCGLGCTFCATGRMGLVQNLEAWEIVEQVRLVRKDLPAGSHVHGVVFQGMGEALSNFEEVKRAIRVLSEPSAQAVDARNITVSTAGLPAGIRALAQELPRVRLAVSLGSARPEARRQLMPIDQAHPLEKVLRAVGEHTMLTRHAPLFAYTLLAGKNDSEDDARALARLVKEFASSYGKRPRLSLIPYNSIGENDPFVRTEAATEAAFRETLIRHEVIPTRRYSGGGDVAAACGQLAARSLDR